MEERINQLRRALISIATLAHDAKDDEYPYDVLFYIQTIAQQALDYGEDGG